MQNFLNNKKSRIDFVINAFFVLALLIICSEVFRFGFLVHHQSFISEIFKYINLVFALFSLLFSIFLFNHEKQKLFKIIKGFFIGFCGIYLAFTILWFFDQFVLNISANNFVIFFSSLIAFLSIGYKISQISYSKMHPAVIFVLSFASLILIGTFLLMLPASTSKNISLIDALFTSTSAVTVTGLGVLDTSKDFTFFGKVVILLLIQLGGLGVLTFSNLFSLLFKSETSFKNRIMVSEMTNEINNANAFKKLTKVVLFTFFIEGIGALLIYSFTHDQTQNSVFFAVFHAVSAFCNAGFSLLSNSLYEGNFQYNYMFQLTIAWLIATGGIGYNIMINHYNFIKYFILGKLNLLFKTTFTIPHKVKKISLNTTIVIKTTFWLLVLGTIGFLIAEWNNKTLQNHDSFFGKMVVSVFNSVTTRTAGFNNVDMSILTTPTLMMFMFLMWIGASPGSTGGGIKTTSFAISLLNLWNHIRGKEKIVIANKQVATSNILMVNSVILLSIFTIGFGTFFLSIFEPKMLMRDLLFECVSAFGTVGLSVGITAKFSVASKVTLVIVMFLGRVSFLTVLIGIYRQIMGENQKKHILYPKDTIFIN